MLSFFSTPLHDVFSLLQLACVDVTDHWRARYNRFLTTIAKSSQPAALFCFQLIYAHTNSFSSSFSFVPFLIPCNSNICRCGQIEKNDEVLTINGILLRGLSVDAALHHLKSPEKLVRIVLVKQLSAAVATTHQPIYATTRVNLTTNHSPQHTNNGHHNTLIPHSNGSPVSTIYEYSQHHSGDIDLDKMATLSLKQSTSGNLLKEEAIKGKNGKKGTTNQQQSSTLTRSTSAPSSKSKKGFGARLASLLTQRKKTPPTTSSITSSNSSSGISSSTQNSDEDCINNNHRNSTHEQNGRKVRSKSTGQMTLSVSVPAGLITPNHTNGVKNCSITTGSSTSSSATLTSSNSVSTFGHRQRYISLSDVHGNSIYGTYGGVGMMNSPMTPTKLPTSSSFAPNLPVQYHLSSASPRAHQDRLYNPYVALNLRQPPQQYIPTTSSNNNTNGNTLQNNYSCFNSFNSSASPVSPLSNALCTLPRTHRVRQHSNKLQLPSLKASSNGGASAGVTSSSYVDSLLSPTLPPALTITSAFALPVENTIQQRDSNVNGTATSRPNRLFIRNLARSTSQHYGQVPPMTSMTLNPKVFSGQRAVGDKVDGDGGEKMTVTFRVSKPFSWYSFCTLTLI